MKISNLMVASAMVVGLAGVASAQDVIQNFDAAAAAAVVVFRDPGFSGSTSANVDTATDAAGVDTTQFNSTPNSYRLFWTWAGAAAADAKVRITTNGATTTPNPAIDLSKKVTLKVKITQGSLANLAILVRETGGSGPIGANAGTTGTIETVSANPVVALDSAVNSNWQTVTFDLPTAANITVAGFTGDGVLANTGFASLEAIYATRGATGASVELFIDDLQQESGAPATAAENWALYN